MSTPPPAAPVSTDVIAIEQALTRVAYLAYRARQHERLMAVVSLNLDRAAAAILRSIAESEPVRPGVLAVRLSVEASHVSLQLRQLEKDGYVIRIQDLDDSRAHLIQLTDAGLAAAERIREVSRRGMQVALADWSSEDMRQLATLFHRLVDDFVTHAEAAVEVGPSA